MNHEIEIAIVIPAYKNIYLRECLESIAAQTDLNFCLYIGDDNSPYNLGGIVEAFTTRLRIRYHKFSENLGGRDLTAHWERCIELTEGEDWIWLFSDDDVMDPKCIAFFRSALTEVQSDIFRFPLQIISENSIVLETVDFPSFISSEEFIKRNLEGSIQSFAVEYIFRRSAFLATGRFERFDLAWGSDFATWAKIGHKYGIHTLKSGGVSWRKSTVNISQLIDKSIMKRKIEATSTYLLWVKRTFNNSFPFLRNKRFLNQVQDGHKVLCLNEAVRACFSHFRRMPSIMFLSWNILFLSVYYVYKKIKCRLEGRAGENG